MNILRKSQEVQVERYALVFEWKDLPGAGFSFTCDKQGTPLLNKMHPVAQQNLTKCLNGGYAVIPLGVRDYSYSYREPALGRCSCHRTVELAFFTNTCDCGLEYNAFGQLLAPRSQWDEW